MYKTFDNRASNIIFQFLLNLKDKNIIFYIPANICPIIPALFIKANIKFKFLDIAKNTFEIDKSKFLNSNLSKKKFGIIWTNGYGKVFDNKNFFKDIKFLNKENIIIDDRCLEIPNINLKKNIADLTVYSTGYSKYVDINFGGFSFSNSKIKYINQTYNVKNYNSLINNFYYCINKKQKINLNLVKKNWLNYNKKFINESYQKVILKSLPKIKNHKKKLNKIYSSIIPKRIQFHEEYNNWRFNIKVKNPNKLLKKIFEKNLFASRHYYPANLIFSTQRLTNTNNAYKQIINLFNDLRFTENQAMQISEIIKEDQK